MKTAGVRELKTHLSAYLREVESGEVILVTDRGRVVAELRPPGEADRSTSPADLRYRRLVDRGLLRPAADPTPFDWSKLPEIGLEPGTAQRILDEDRGE
jgi:prevent-host-death family protein